ncbi:hypothetical protein MASR2M48_28250 [Spirochaetota bacterium]
MLFLYALVIPVKDDSKIQKKAFFLALAIGMDGQKELLGLWAEQNEGAKFWLNVLNELKNRGVQDILIAAVDGLTGIPEAINAVLPKAEVQLCIVHMVHNSLMFVPFKDRKQVATNLKKIYLSPPPETARGALDAFAEKWDIKYPMIARSWRTKWPEVIPFLKFPEVIRKAVYTTNAIESLNYSIRKVTLNRQSFPTTEAAMKLIFMALQNISKRWNMPLRDWRAAVKQFAIIYGDRVPL